MTVSFIINLLIFMSMVTKFFNQIRFAVGLIGLLILTLLGLSEVMSAVDCCLFSLWLGLFVLLSKNLKYAPWILGLTAFYMAFPFLGYHCPLVAWEAPESEILTRVVLYGDKLMALCVNAFLYFMAVVALLSLACAVIGGFFCYNKSNFA